MMQDSSMYGSQGSAWDLAQAWLGDQHNNVKQLADGGLEDLQESNEFPGAGSIQSSEDILPLDLDDLSMDWMEECVQLDKLLGVSDNVSLLDDAAFHQMQLLASTPGDGLNMHFQEELEQNHTEDPFQQLLQLQAMIDPEIITTPTLEENHTQDPIQQLLNIQAMIEPEIISTLPLSSQSCQEIVLSSFSDYTPIEDNTIMLDTSEPHVTESSQTSYRNEGQEIINSPPLSPQSIGDVVLISSDYVEDEVEIFLVTSPCPTLETSSTDLEPTTCGLYPKLVSFQDVRFIENLSDDDASSSSSCQISDNSSYSFYDSKKGSTPNRKRGNASSSGVDRQTKRLRKTGPNKQPTVKNKREKKKDQNKTASTRYRLKKRSETEIVLKEEAELIVKNKELQSNVDKLSSEIGYLKGFLKEILLAKCSKK